MKTIAGNIFSNKFQDLNEQMDSIKKRNTAFRGELFRHLDGIAVAPVSYSLYVNKVTDYLLSSKEVSVAKIATDLNANEGYLNVALRIIGAQGWLDYQVLQEEVVVKINAKSKIAFDYFYL